MQRRLETKTDRQRVEMNKRFNEFEKYSKVVFQLKQIREKDRSQHQTLYLRFLTKKLKNIKSYL